MIDFECHAEYRQCAIQGRHYVDLTAETPWVKEMIEKYASHSLLFSYRPIQYAQERRKADCLIFFSLYQRVRLSLLDLTR